MCKVLGVTESGYYKSIRNREQPSKCELRRSEVLNNIYELLREDEENANYGTKRIYLGVKIRFGYTGSYNTILRHHRTIHSLCFGGTLACIFSVMCHKPRQQRICSCFLSLFNLTKNLSAQLYHQNCAVVP